MRLVLRSVVFLSLVCSACQSTTGTMIVLNKSDHNASLFALDGNTQLTLPTADGRRLAVTVEAE
ncbi:MAG: hypothetical protein ACI9EF_002390 [Pseudohongiellaceae bacterium]|jgi:hypothetical protein